MAGVLVWNARRHLRQIVSMAWRTKTWEQDAIKSIANTDNGEGRDVRQRREEYAGYQPLFFGFIVGVLGVFAWCVGTGLPLWFSLVIAFAARNSAAYFTTWYPQYRKARYGAAPTDALPGTN